MCSSIHSRAAGVAVHLKLAWLGQCSLETYPVDILVTCWDSGISVSVDVIVTYGCVLVEIRKLISPPPTFVFPD